jgi:hypothetical protein
MSTSTTNRATLYQRGHSCRDAGHAFAREGRRAHNLGATGTALAWWRQARDEYETAATMYAECGADAMRQCAEYHARECTRAITWNGGQA